MDRNYHVRQFTGAGRVALRKESVDRNRILPLSGLLCCVALRKESVDRNTNPGSTSLTFPGRSPQGERG